MKKLPVVASVVGLAVAAMLVGLLALRAFVGRHVVAQNGMYPTITRGSWVLSWRRPYATVDDVKRGDVVLFHRVLQGRTYLYIWRVVALPGETVRAVGSDLSVNGVPLVRERVREEDQAVIFQETSGDLSYLIAIARSPKHVPPELETAVGPDEVFVMGDNRYDAVDSRHFGPIKFESIVGKRF